MRLLLTGGGTGGHINPAIAIAQYARANDPSGAILYAGTPDGMEASLVEKAGFDFAPIRVQGFYRSMAPKDILHNLHTVEVVIKARPRARKILQEFQPDVVIGTGGYVSGPVVMEAARMGIKTAIHEQNAFPGITNRMLAKHADMVFLAVEEAKAHLAPKSPCQVVGNPVRDSVVYKSKRAARQELGLDDSFCILSFGGSLGADALNRIGADLIAWHGREGKINHIHGYGRLGREKFPRFLEERGVRLGDCPRVRVTEFIDNMDACMAAADLLISRAGAITICEIEATGKASLLVPSPNVTANHQYHNAMVLVSRGAALLLEEKDYSSEKVVSLVRDLYENPKRLQELSQRASELAILDTAKRICDGLSQLAAGR